MPECRVCRSCGHLIEPGERHITWEEAKVAREKREKRQVIAVLSLRTMLSRRLAGVYARFLGRNVKAAEAK